MLLTEDKEIIDIYNTKILEESQGSNAFSNDAIKQKVFDYCSDKTNLNNLTTKLLTHMQGTGSSGSMFKNIQYPIDLTTPVNIINAIFNYKPKGVDRIEWKKYANIGGNSSEGYYRSGFPFGLFGIKPISNIDENRDIELKEKTTSESGFYPIEATIKVKESKLIETDIVTIIFTGYRVSSIYPGPQVNNINVDQNIMNALKIPSSQNRVRMNNKIPEDIQKNEIDQLVKFVKLI